MPTTFLSPLIATRPIQRHPSVTTPSSPRSVFSDALSSYRSQTKIDISLHPLLPTLQNCDSPESIRTVLHAQAPEFVTGEEGWLTTAVDVLHAFSSTLGKRVGMVHIRQAYVPSLCFLSLVYRYSHPRTQFLLPLVSSSKCVSSSIAAYISRDSQIYQPANHSGVSQETLINLFQRMQTFFQRLKVYAEVPLTERLKDVIVQFMAEVLLILAVLTKSINQRRSSEFNHGNVSYLTDGFDSANYFQLVRSFTPPLGSKSRSLRTSERRLSRSSDSRNRRTQGAFNRLDKLMQDEEELGTDEMRSYSSN